MADITKCADNACPSRDRCWRFCAPASAEQTYAIFGRHRGDLKCDDFVGVTPIEKRGGKGRSEIRRGRL